jgi:hypothetical protein
MSNTIYHQSAAGRWQHKMLVAVSYVIVVFDVMFAFSSISSISRFTNLTAFECQLRLLLITRQQLSKSVHTLVSMHHPPNPIIHEVKEEKLEIHLN